MSLDKLEPSMLIGKAARLGGHILGERAPAVVVPR